MPNKYILNAIVTHEENLESEFKGFSEIEATLVKKRLYEFTAKYINAFLNGEGGTLYLGVEKDGKITGIPLDRKDRDDVQVRISQTITQFYPPVEPSLYRINFKPIWTEQGQSQSSSLHIIEIHVAKGLENIYWTQNNEGAKSYIKLHGQVISTPPAIITQRLRSGRQTIPSLSAPIKSSKSEGQNYSFSQTQHLSVKRPTIELICQLPLAFGQGFGELKLKSLESRNLSIKLTHKELLGNLMFGLKTPLSKMIRPYISQVDKDLFKVNLGQTIINLRLDEVVDLCECIDEVCQTYKQIVMGAENTLQTHYYTPTKYKDVYGFVLMQVRAELWTLMLDFSHKFEQQNGNSEWHIFQWHDETIRIRHNINDCLYLHPIPSISFYPYTKSTSYVDLIYEVNDLYLSWHNKNGNKWQLAVGKQGIWTIPYAKEWTKTKLIPKVLQSYNKTLPRHLFNEINQVEEKQLNRLHFSQINTPQDLIPYLHDIQVWLSYPQRKIQASSILPYYTTLVRLNEFTGEKNIDLGYISGKLHGGVNISRKNYHSLQEVIVSLTQHIRKIQKIGFEDSDTADNISRVFLAIIEENNSQFFDQSKLNQAVYIVEKLWHENRFERYHVFPNL
ncbi:MAG: ATP-binding protein [Ardenticatenaceae bacterium]|nr:ATP-binding protein [Ardenticatenaceae bacterium]